MIPYCREHWHRSNPWSPLARGILTGAYQGSLEGGTTTALRGPISNEQPLCIAVIEILRSPLDALRLLTNWAYPLQSSPSLGSWESPW